MSFNCKLCSGANLVKVNDIPSKTIAAVYKLELGIDLGTVDCEPLVSSISMFRCHDCSLIQFSPDWIGSPSLYEALQNFPWYYQKTKSEFNITKSLVKTGDSILEVGCATGNFRSHLPENICYSGIEFNQKALDEARLRGLDVSAVPLDKFAARHPERFDCVFAFQVLEHVSQPREFLIDMMRAAKSGGLVVFSVPSEDSFLGYEVNNVTNFPPHHATRWSDATFERLGDLLDAQLVNIEHEPLSADHRRAYASAQAWRVISRIIPAGRNGLSPTASSKLIRRAIALGATPIRFWAAVSPAPIRGHTVTVTLRKI